MLLNNLINIIGFAKNMNNCYMLGSTMLGYLINEIGIYNNGYETRKAKQWSCIFFL